MRTTKHINLVNIEVDNHPLNPSTLELVDYLREGGLVPAIKVIKTSTGSYKIRDGRHRVTAYKLLGRDKILAKFWEE